jgi:hypothetical protein
MRNGVCYRRRALERATDASASSFWPTARSGDVKDGDYQYNRGDTTGASGVSMTLCGASKLWTTPNVPSRGPESQTTKDARGSGGVDLQTQVINWPTPDASPHKVCGGENQNNLAKASQNWPTPDANCHKGSTQPGQRVGQLDEAAEVLHTFEPTPSPSSPPDQPIPDGPTSSPSRPRLSPQFVSWLMGWPPLAESGFVFSETEWCHFKQRQQSSLSGMRWREIGNDGDSLFS